MQKISYICQGQRVDGTLFFPKEGDIFPGVILIHGSGSSEKNYLPIARLFAKQGIAALTLNLRGHGTSDGDFEKITAHENAFDVLVAYDLLASREHIDPARIGVLGSSYGAVLASLLSRERTIKSMLLRVPAAYTTEMMSMGLKKILEDEKRVFKQLTELSATPPIRAISGFTGNLLVIASENDELIPRAIPEAYISSAVNADKRELKIIGNAKHVLSDGQRKIYAKLAVDWFRKTL